MGYQTITPSSRSLIPSFHGLIVDDAPMDGFIASCILRQEGYKVTLAKSGMEAIEAVTKTNFDFVLMDVRMPGMDGFEATHRIRQLEGLNRQMPILALTAMDLREQKTIFFNAGMDGVMSKPIDPDALRATLSWAKKAKPEPDRLPEITGKTLCQNQKIMPDQTRDGTRHEPIKFLEEELAFSQPQWADFSLEGAFWSALSEICLTEKLAPDSFVRNAKQRHLEMSPESAVRLAIISYFVDQTRAR